MTIVHIGNSHAVESYKVDPEGLTDEVAYRDAPGERITELTLPPGLSIPEAGNTVIAALSRHLKPDTSPDWVSSDNSPLQRWLEAYYGLDTPVPKDYGEASGAQAVLAFPLLLLGSLAILASTRLALRTNSGRDFQHGVMFNTASTGTGSFAPACWIGLSADTTPPTITDTTLVGEIISGTLTRAQATYAHTTGTSSSTLTKLFTADQTIVVAKMGIFNAASGGSPVLVDMLLTVGTLASGDQMSASDTITL